MKAYQPTLNICNIICEPIVKGTITSDKILTFFSERNTWISKSTKLDFKIDYLNKDVG